MNIFPTGLPCEEDHNFEYGKEGKVMEIQEQKQEEERGSNGHGVELEFEIWPVEHPMEPQDEDRPVKCPMPHSSVINVTNFSLYDEGKREKKLAESLRKRGEEASAANAESFSAVRAVRKRQHALTGGDDHIIVMHPLPSPTTTQNPNSFHYASSKSQI